MSGRSGPDRRKPVKTPARTERNFTILKRHGLEVVSWSPDTLRGTVARSETTRLAGLGAKTPGEILPLSFRNLPDVLRA